MAKNNDNNLLSFQPFCGLHYTSESDVGVYGEKYDKFVDSTFILYNYVNYFTNLVLSMFKVHNLPNDINEQFVIRTLIQYGSIAVFEANTGIEIQPFTTNGKYNIYGEPTSITLRNAPNCATEYSGKQLTDKNKFEIIKLNPQATSLYSIIMYFCNKITEVQRAIDVNVYSNQTPLVWEVDPEQRTTIENVINKMFQQVKNIIINKKAGWRVDDGVKIAETGVQWKATQMTEVLQYYKSEFFTFLGINHIPYEKKANMIKDEVLSNSHILKLTINSMTDTLNECAKRVNEKFGTKIYFEYTLDNIYAEEFDSESDAKFVAGIISEEEKINEKLEEAKIKDKINNGGVEEN